MVSRRPKLTMIGTTTTDGDDELQRRYKHLQQDWDSYKKSKSTTTPTPSDIEHLMNISPGDLMSSLQSLSSSDSTVMMMEEGEKEKDVVVEDPRIQRIVRQRKAVIASGELKARRLLEALDQEEEEVRSSSVCSSVLTRGGDDDKFSMCSCCSCDGDDESGFDGYYSSSSSFSLRGERGVGGSGVINGGKWLVLKVLLMMVISLVGVVVMVSVSGGVGGNETLVPT